MKIRHLAASAVIALGVVATPVAAQASKCVPAITHSNSYHHLIQTLKITHACTQTGSVISVAIIGWDANANEHIGKWVSVLNATSTTRVYVPNYFTGMQANYKVQGSSTQYELESWAP